MTDKIKTTTIDRRSGLSDVEFVEHYKDTSTPVVLEDLTSSWPARQKWTLAYLTDIAGEQIVPVYSSQPATGKQHQHAAEKHITIAEYFNMLQAGENDLRMFFYNILENVPSLIEDFSYPNLGMKFFKRLPVLFVGGRGAKVQMHYDIDLANLVLCHFGGPKRVLLIPPEQTPFMYKVPYSFSALHEIDFCNPDFDRYPALKQLSGYQTTLQHGDALYIPSGFWHYIVYEDIGFSMTLRSMPTSLAGRTTLLKNIFITRTIEGLMRRLVGQKWNDRNERTAVLNTHRMLKR